MKADLKKAEERISKLKVRTMGIKKSKKQKKSEQRLRDLWATIKWTKTSTVGATGGGEIEKGTENI